MFAGDHLIQHEKFVHVQEDPGKVANKKEEDDAKQDGCQIHFRCFLLVVPFGSFVRHLNSAENVPIEEN